MGQRHAGAEADIGLKAQRKTRQPQEAVQRQHVVAVARLELAEDIAQPRTLGRRGAVQRPLKGDILVEAGERLRMGEVEHGAEAASTEADDARAIVDRVDEGLAVPGDIPGGEVVETVLLEPDVARVSVGHAAVAGEHHLAAGGGEPGAGGGGSGGLVRA